MVGGRDEGRGERGMWYTNETETDADKLEMWSSRREHLVLHSFVYVARIQVWIQLGGKSRGGTTTDLEAHMHTIHASDSPA